MAQKKIVTLGNLTTFKNQCDATYGKVKTVNNTSPDANGNVSLTIPSSVTSVNGLSGGTISSTTTINGDMIASYVKIASIGHETTSSYDKHLTLSSTNYVRYRTTAELKSDLGIPSGTIATTNDIPNTSNFIQKATSTTPAADKIYSGTTSSLSPSQCLANGFYYVSSSSTTGNDANPFYNLHTSNTDFRILATSYSDAWVQQIATDFRSTKIYIRKKENGTWSAWKEIVTTDNLGDQVTYAYSNGTLTITSK